MSQEVRTFALAFRESRGRDPWPHDFRRPWRRESRRREEIFDRLRTGKQGNAAVIRVQPPAEARRTMRQSSKAKENVNSQTEDAIDEQEQESLAGQTKTKEK